MVPVSNCDGRTITASPTPESDFPAANMLDQRRSKKMRITGSPAAITLNFSLTSGTENALSATGFCIDGHTLPEGSTIRLRLYDDLNQTGTVVYDSTDKSVDEIIPWGEFVASVDEWGDVYEIERKKFTLWFDTVQYKSFRVSIAQPATPSTFIDMERIFIGWGFAPKLNANYGAAITKEDPSIQNSTAGGGLRTENIRANKVFDLTFGQMVNSERAIMSDMLDKAAKGNDMLVSLNPLATGKEKLDGEMMCKRINDSAFSHTNYERHSITLKLKES
jgi:hypothetical protein